MRTRSLFPATYSYLESTELSESRKRRAKTQTCDGVDCQVLAEVSVLSVCATILTHSYISFIQ